MGVGFYITSTANDAIRKYSDNIDIYGNTLVSCSRVLLLKKKLVNALYSMIWTCIVAFGILILINVFHLTRESTNWDTTAILCSAIGLIYSASCFVRVLQLTGKIDKKSHSKVIIASLILAGGLFVLTIVAVLYGCGIIG